MEVRVYEFGPGIMVIEGVGPQVCPGCAAEETSLDLTDVDALTEWFRQAFDTLAAINVRFKHQQTPRQAAEEYLKEPWHEEA